MKTKDTILLEKAYKKVLKEAEVGSYGERMNAQGTLSNANPAEVYAKFEELTDNFYASLKKVKTLLDSEVWKKLANNGGFNDILDHEEGDDYGSGSHPFDFDDWVSQVDVKGYYF